MVIWGLIVLWVLTLAGAEFLIIRNRRQVRGEMERALQLLDDALHGKEAEYAYDESVNAAIGERINKLLHSLGTRRNQAMQERDVVKALIADISHQVRTPLTNIILYTELLRERQLEEKAEVLAGKIKAQSEKLNFYMQELLNASYVETDMMVLAPGRSSIEELLTRSCQAIELSALKKEINVRCEETDLFCIFDLRWTVEALINILENAIKYSPQGATIELSVQPNEAFTCIRVRDYGMGIREEEQGLIFQRFYRSGDARKEAGFGIGLYVVREILLRQGGYIKVESTWEVGSTFSMFLPNFSSANVSDVSYLSKD